MFQDTTPFGKLMFSLSKPDAWSISKGVRLLKCIAKLTKRSFEPDWISLKAPEIKVLARIF